ncbi:hypothetical protein D3C77_483450 [compost metagenome]
MQGRALACEGGAALQVQSGRGVLTGLVAGAGNDLRLIAVMGQIAAGRFTT